ncbi:hypothetical protein GCM10009555_017930 [Acrocarpospora macrocephala]|uniref:Uncharacterized protein n=1 Tax=Acrocarpospora macrocephala TaxID=150177 RepID=A0A5M3WK76_9ACTN|nr:hypothetical protein [Acrocarpospora macrocephala]GES07453.1 hypothetical protein Amac_010480 [Acrocarpospora macrocephala]
MIEFVIRNGPPQALICPEFICDTCRKQVTASGNLLYARRTDPRQTSPVFVAHKGACDRALTKWLGTAYPEADGWHHSWEEIQFFLSNLVHNFDHPYADDPDGEYLDHQLVLPLAGAKSRTR